MSQKISHAVAINLAVESLMRSQRLQLRAKQKDIAAPAEIKRLFAHAVAAQEKYTLLPVPQSKGEHAVKLLHCCGDAPDIERSQHDFSIGMAAEVRRSSAGDEFCFQPFGVINFAVVRDYIAA